VVLALNWPNGWLKTVPTAWRLVNRQAANPAAARLDWQSLARTLPLVAHSMDKSSLIDKSLRGDMEN
jgi:hypothetical protein